MDPSMRASDADRERVAEVLRDAHAEGRLSTEELSERLDATFAARTHGELVPVTRDLPSPRPQPRPRPAKDPWRRVRRRAGLTVFIVGIWAIIWLTSGSPGGYWVAWPVGVIWLSLLARWVSGGARRPR